jgi:RNase H-like domain found in reverse transcriptase
MSLYGSTRGGVRSYYFLERFRSRQDKNRNNRETTTPTSVKEIRNFLSHAGFYRRFIKDFFKIAKPLTNLTMKDVDFNFDEHCLETFYRLKKALVSAPILQPSDWRLPFEIMYDTSDYAVGAVLG